MTARHPLEPGELRPTPEGFEARSPDGAWRVTGKTRDIRERGGVIVAIELATLHLEPFTKRRKAPALTTSVLRALPLGRWTDELRRHSHGMAQGWAQLFEGWGDESSVDTFQQSADALRQRPRRPGRAAHDEHHWASVAIRYVQLCEAGERAPAAVIAHEANAALPTVKGWIGAARRKGYLTGAQNGRAGAVEGPALLEYLSKQKEADQ